MAMVKTDLGETRERARELRFEATGSISATNVQKAIEEVASSPVVVVPTAVNFAMSPYAVQPTDFILDVDTTAGAVTINAQASAARGGSSLVVKDVGGHAAANPITINPAGGETIDGLLSLPIDSNYGGYNLRPRTGSYTIDP